MSFSGSGDSPNPNDPSNPLHYAPRSVRNKASPQARLDRPTPPRSGFDETLTDAVGKSRRHPLDPEVVQQPDPPRARFGVVSSLTAAIGVAAIIGVVFFMMIPKSQGSDPVSAGAASVPEDTQALLQKFVQFDKSKEDPSTGSVPTTSTDLQKFMQWKQKQQ